jgi:chromosome segregation ATPase
MKEQHERFRGKVLSSKSLASPSLAKVHDLLVPSENLNSSPNPGLTIAVTMSEDEGEENVNHGDISDANNESVWAMMEHYQFAKDDESQNISRQLQHTIEQGGQSFFDLSLGYESYSYQSSESSQLQQIPRQDIFVPSKQAMNVKQIAALEKNAACETPVKIEWHENEDGELVQNSFFSQESVSPLSTVGYDDDLSHTQSLVGGELEASRNEIEMDDSRSSRFSPSPNILKSQPTPARLMRKWQGERKTEDGDSTPHASLLLESMIQSDCQQISELGADESFPVQEESQASISPPDDETQLPALSLQTSEAGKVQALASKPSNELVAINAEKQLVERNGNETYTHLSRIKLLEQSLQEQRLSTDNVQSKLKHRVVELEQALRATAATPRGTIIQENPLKTLLDRNQTLVKEVRFADQTCVELSSTISKLEAQNKILQEQISTLETENDELRQDNQDNKEEYESLDQDDSKANSSITLSSDIMSVEMTRARSESDFLGRQLGIVQEKLDIKVKELEDERSKFKVHEDHWKVEVEKHLSKIETLEKHMHLYVDGPTSQHLHDAEKRVFTLQKELVQAKASIAALKHISGQIEPELASSVDSYTLGMVQEALSKMYSQYQNLDLQVNDIVGKYIERIEKLTDSVEYLRSSLLFETESLSSRDEDKCSSHVMNATIDSSQNSHREDQRLELMEEARSPPKAKVVVDSDEPSSDFDDISQLFADDATLESQTKCGSIVTSPSAPERWKEPLEAAIKECQIVRDRSSKLKEQVDMQKATIQMLEHENGQLCLEASRKVEEKNMVEKALDEAKEMIKELEVKLQSIAGERDVVLHSDQVKDKHLSFLELKKREIESQLSTEHAKQGVLENRIAVLEHQLSETKYKFEDAATSNTLFKARCDGLVAQLDKKEVEVTEKKNAEIIEIQQSLKKSESQVEETMKLHEEAINKLSHTLAENSAYQKTISRLESKNQYCVSDAEDRVLESQCNLESMRRERAELRSKVSKKEKDVASVTESFLAYREKTQKQMDLNVRTVRVLESERSAISLQAEELNIERKNFYQSLLSIDDCANLIGDMAMLEDGYESSGDEAVKCVRELSYWKEIVPRLGETIQSLCKTKGELNQLRQEAETLSEDLVLLKTSEIDYKKQIADEREQNQKFYELLSQAEIEMERSASQIREMSGALSRLQQKEFEANGKVKAAESECTMINQEFQRLQNEMTFERNKLETKINDLTADLEYKESRILETNGLL